MSANEHRQLGKAPARRRAEARHLRGSFGSIQRTGPRLAREREQPPEGHAAHPAPRVVDHAFKRIEVARIRHQAEVGQNVLNLAPFVEAHAPDDLIR